MRIIWLILCISSFVSAMDNPSIQPIQEEYEIFNAIKKLREIAYDAREEVRRTMGFADDREISQLEPNEHIGQTRQGLLLEMKDFPETVFTSFGRAEIVQQDSHFSDKRGSIAAAQLFFKRVNVTVFGFHGFSKNYNEVTQPITASTQLESVIKRNTKGTLSNYIGTSKLLVPRDHNSCILYAVTHVDSQEVPIAQAFDHNSQKRDPETIAMLWKLMEKRYEKEKIKKIN